MEWQPIDTAPTDGTRFDCWCVDPDVSFGGCRMPDVQMRGDKSGFGFVIHTKDDVIWQYLDARDKDSIYPEWMPTHWMHRPDPPATT